MSFDAEKVTSQFAWMFEKVEWVENVASRVDEDSPIANFVLYGAVLDSGGWTSIVSGRRNC